MFIKLIEAASDKLDVVTIYKKGRNTDNIYSREIGPKDWESKAGYRCRVWSQDEKNAQDSGAIEKLNATAQFFQGNSKFTEIQQRKLLEFDGLTPDEINEVMKMQQDMMMQANNQMGMGAPGLAGAPMQQPSLQAPTPQDVGGGPGFTSPPFNTPAQTSSPKPAAKKAAPAKKKADHKGTVDKLKALRSQLAVG